MESTGTVVRLIVPASALVFLGCAGADNPTALAELEPHAEFEVAAARVETFEETEIRIRVMEGGASLAMRDGELEVEHVGSGTTWTLSTTGEGDEHTAHVTFYRPGEHHVHFMGMPHGHRLMREMGDVEIEVHRRHQVIGPYWVELEIEPAPVMEGTTAHIHLFAFELADGVPGAPAASLEMHLEAHDPFDGRSMLEVIEEEPGAYETQYAFGAAGVYELHVEIEVGAGHEEGEFHIPALSPDAPAGDGDGGDGDGHGH